MKIKVDMVCVHRSAQVTDRLSRERSRVVVLHCKV